MLRLITLSIAASASLFAQGATAQARAEHAAACVAALRVDADAMAEQLRRGRAEVEPELRRRLQEGFAFIGTAYKQGLREADANRLLKDAEQAQLALPPRQLAERQVACRAEGARLLAGANVVEQALVERAADRRIQKFKRSRESRGSAGASATAS